MSMIWAGRIAIVAWGVEKQGADINTDRKGDHLVADVYIEANRQLEADPSQTGGD